MKCRASTRCERLFVYSGNSVRLNHSAAFSLIEIMVSVTLLSLIVIGLLAVFNYTQRALRFANNKTDVLEGARAVVDLLGRDLQEMYASGNVDAVNLSAAFVTDVLMPLPGGDTQTNILQDVYFLSRHNDEVRATGYFIDQKRGGPVATLYRFSTNAPWHGLLPNPGTNYDTTFVANWFLTFKEAVGTSNLDVHRIVDGVVHFQARAFDAKGRFHDEFWFGDYYYPELTNNVGKSYDWNAVSITSEEITNNIYAGQNWFWFEGDCLPAYIEIEIGILEPEITRQYNLINDADSTAGYDFLTKQVGRVHLFRQRIPVRNQIKPEALF